MEALLATILTLLSAWNVAQAIYLTLSYLETNDGVEDK